MCLNALVCIRAGRAFSVYALVRLRDGPACRARLRIMHSRASARHQAAGAPGGVWDAAADGAGWCGHRVVRAAGACVSTATPGAAPPSPTPGTPRSGRTGSVRRALRGHGGASWPHACAQGSAWAGRRGPRASGRSLLRRHNSARRGQPTHPLPPALGLSPAAPLLSSALSIPSHRVPSHRIPLHPISSHFVSSHLSLLCRDMQLIRGCSMCGQFRCMSFTAWIYYCV